MPPSKNTAPPRASVVVIDDERNMTKILSRILEVEGYRVRAFNDPREALAAIEEEPPDLTLTDVRMPEMSGTQVLGELKKKDSSMPVIMLTAFSSIDGAVEAIQLGADDYISKPFQTGDLLVKLDKALSRRALIEENKALAAHLSGHLGEIHLIGDSPSMQHVRAMIAKIGATDSAALITGESGTGKELVARAIYKSGPRANGRFVPINCATIPEPLIESELFGHEKGAFTGAAQRKLGLVELASGGTLFLDEIGELPVHLQPKLLRMLQEREIQRVGGLAPIPVDIRLIAATNRNLEEAIAKGFFRQDLYYRLNVINLQLEPLRKRRTDIPLLARHFLGVLGKRLRKEHVTLSPAAMQILQSYSWPGNVRELENIIERMLVLLAGDVIRVEDIPTEIRASTVIRQPDSADSNLLLVRKDKNYKEAQDDFDRSYLTAVLEDCGGNASEAARRAGISRRNFYDKMLKLEINIKDFKD